MQRFTDEVALVTGAGSGIGRATALEFARCGARVAAVDVDLASAQETVALSHGPQGGEMVALQADVSRAGDVERVTTQTVERFGRLDCAFNNAGITGEAATIVDCSEENWDRVIAVNLKGVWLCMKYQLRQMLAQGKGAIVNNSSVAGLVGIHDEVAPYAPSKHGVLGLTRTAALENAERGVRINAVCPGEILTPMQEAHLQGSPELMARAIESEPIGRLGGPEEVAAAVLWLCSDAASFVTGHAMAVDGGYTAR